MFVAAFVAPFLPCSRWLCQQSQVTVVLLNQLRPCLLTRPSVSKPEVAGDEDKFALAFARIENHFFVNGGFFEWETWLLDHVDRIRHIPTVIIQGAHRPLRRLSCALTAIG